MKNNQEYLNSVMKKYSKAKAKRRQTVTVLSSVAVCLVLFVAGTQIVPSVMNDSIGEGAVISYTPSFEQTVSRAESIVGVTTIPTLSVPDGFGQIEEINPDENLSVENSQTENVSSVQDSFDKPVSNQGSEDSSAAVNSGQEQASSVAPPVSSNPGGQSYLVNYDSDSTNDKIVKPGITSGSYSDSGRPIEGGSNFDPQWIIGGLLTLFAVVGVVLVIQKHRK